MKKLNKLDKKKIKKDQETILINYESQNKIHKNKLMSFLIKNDVSFNFPEKIEENDKNFDAIVKIYNIKSLGQEGLEFFDSLKKSPQKKKQNKINIEKNDKQNLSNKANY